MGFRTKLAIFLVLVAGGGVAYALHAQKKKVEDTKTAQVEAQKALMHSEELVWTLEGECLKDAERVLSQPEAKKIVEGDETAKDPARIEARLRSFLRIRRNKDVWKAAERAFITMTPDSRAATNDAAAKAGLRPVDILAEWMTCEGATDLHLMGKVWTDRKTLRETVGPAIDEFFEANAPHPKPEKGVTILELKDDRIVVGLFGAKVIEECVPGKAELVGDGKVKISWKSNYNFLRDVVRGKKPQEVLEETLVPTDEGYSVEYADWIAEYLAGGDQQPWATLLCSKGALALGELLTSKAEAAEEKAAGEGEKKPEGGEKKAEGGEKKAEGGEKKAEGEKPGPAPETKKE